MSVAVVTLGCARNEVDSEELAGRLEAGGFVLVAEPGDADTVLVNTCGFVEAAKKDSVDTLLAAADLKETGKTQAVVAVGCLAERYGKDLAESLPEADAVLGFDDYPDIAAKLRSIVAGEVHHPHTPSDRRRLLPISPVDRDASAISMPGHADNRASTDEIGQGAPATGPRVVRRRLDAGPMAPLKLASGCDRRCSFCAIPSFRGSFVSRRPSDVLQEAQWLATQDIKELFLVSENSTSYGKDLGDLRLLETMLPELAAIEGIARVRVSYLQPAETRPGLIEAIADTPGVVPYFDLSFQHASATVLRRMRRFGDPESFLDLLARIRKLSPLAGVRSNVIVGFPGETEDDLQTLCDFLEAARMDVDRRLRLLRRGRHRGRSRTTTSWTRTRCAPAPSTSPPSSRSSTRSAPRSASARPSACSSSPSRTVCVEGRAEHQGPEVDGTTTLDGVRCPGRRPRHRGSDRDRWCRPRRRTPRRRWRPRMSDRREPGLQLQHRQRADDAAHRAGAGPGLGAAARRRRLDDVALDRLRASSSAR